MIAFAFATFHAPKKASLAEKTFDSPRPTHKIHAIHEMQKIHKITLLTWV